MGPIPEGWSIKTMGKINLKLVASDRECFPCTACCTSKGVLELRKPGGVPCVHLDHVVAEGPCATRRGGCTVYEGRPESCQEYTCFWLAGYMGDDYRPDKVGFVLDVDRSIHSGVMMLAATESWPGAFQDDKVIYRLKKLVKEMDEPIVANKHAIITPNSAAWRKLVQELFGKDVATVLV